MTPEFCVTASRKIVIPTPMLGKMFTFEKPQTVRHGLAIWGFFVHWGIV